MNKMQTIRLQTQPLALHDIAGRRREGDALLKALDPVPLLPGVQRRLIYTTTPDNYELELAWYSLTSTTDVPTSAVLHMHGGGMIAFNIHDSHTMLNNTVAISGVPLLTVNYRLAPEHPFPVPVNDCYTALTWLRSHAKELNVDPARIGTMGESAGGGLAAAVGLLDRDRGGCPPIAKQILVYPMLDNHNVAPLSVEDHLQLSPYLTHSWDDNLTCWTAYLGKTEKGAAAGGTIAMDSEEARFLKYAAPTRETDLSRLPPAYIDVGDLDIFVNEDVDYANRLIDCGVDVEQHVYPGAPHAFELLVPQAEVSKKAVANRIKAIRSF